MQIISSIKNLIKRDHTYVASSLIQWHGNKYGGFYLNSSLLSPLSSLFSFGIGEDISFDLAVSQQGVQNIFLFDPTPKSINFIKRQNLPENFRFYPVGISDENGYSSFFLPKDNNNVSGSLSVHKQLDSEKIISVHLKKLSTITEELNINQLDVLKMDIEGSEYRVLRNIMHEDIFPTQICVEFHNSFYKNGEKLFDETLSLMKQSGYEVGAISQSGKEYLFIKST
jgi:FkbM family methyltransferase